MKYISKIVFLLSLFSLLSCSLDDVEYIGITKKDVIKNEKTAQTVLNGVYQGFKERAFGGLTAYITDNVQTMALYGIYSKNISLYNKGTFVTNSLTPKGRELKFLEGYYTNMYHVIDTANELINLLETDTQNSFKILIERKKEMLGEAKALRALAHFMLLQNFGEFYDINSTYGIVIADKVLNQKSKSRSTVAEVYNFIVKDLEYATKNARTDVDKKIYVSKTTATALLARVYLYMGDYSNAAVQAKKVIDANNNYKLATNYASIFTDRWNSSEVLFCLFPDKKGLIIGNTTTSVYPSSNFYDLIKDESVRKSTHPQYSVKTFFNKYPFLNNEPQNTHYFMRMAEVYLIYSEAKARLGENTEALEYLNKVRVRASAPKKTFSDKKTLLDDIRKEKAIELILENGETWFDAVRYDRLGDIVLGKLKPTLAKNPKNPTETEPYKLIYPIPYQIIEGNNKLIQNKGYDLN